MDMDYKVTRGRCSTNQDIPQYSQQGSSGIYPNAENIGATDELEMTKLETDSRYEEGSTSTPPPSMMEPIVEVISPEEISKHICEQCGKLYKQKGTLAFHLRYECGKEPQFSCDFCDYKAKRKTSLNSHVAFKHKDMINLYLGK
ncbi:sal-like protein 2 [Macrosteles quadrilineatus]|uniref:sal-like protein 2 n=1 Tax=Macrosteles quadrilineatus TaxID=74068 RepID=UPI0023E1F074|nr:sal-like protein 2 [Macrosteles quadrilineatus]